MLTRLILALTLVGAIFAGGLPATLTPASAAPDSARSQVRAIENEIVAALQRVESASVSIVGHHRLARGSRARPTGPLVLHGAGSGVVIEWNGTWVLTNAHVVDADGVGKGGNLEAVTSAGRAYPLKVHTLDRHRDLAIARLTGTPVGLRAARISAALPGRLAIGTWVSSSGNPFLLALDGRSAATLGVISAMRPPRRGGMTKIATVQHDAEVNPGNSGGPLWNLRGELLGINGSIATRSADREGVGAHYTGASFAIPTAEIRSFLTRTLGPERASTVAAAAAPQALRSIEGSYRKTIQRVMPSAVVCIPRGVVGPSGGRSSGVVVHPRGLVLSDGDAGLVFDQVRVDGRTQRQRRWTDHVDVRLWHPETQRWRTIAGRVVHRDRSIDTSLIQLLEIPVGGMQHFVPPGRSTDLQVGDGTLAMGSAYDPTSRGPPALTAGIVSTIDDGPDGFLFTSSGVNPGVNGGALVDLRGRLIGTISTYVEAGQNAPYGFLGKAVPIDRILDGLRNVRAARALLATRVRERDDGGSVRALEAVTRLAGRRIRPHLVSLEIQRKRPVSRRVPLGGETVLLDRYAGPVSGIIADRGGLIVTSLYNLTNVAQRVNPLWEVPTGASLTEGLTDILRIRAHRSNGQTSELELLGYDMRWGYALLRAKDPKGWGAGAPAASQASLERGRFVIAAGDPFGARRPKDPLLTRGILSKMHQDTAPSAWRGMWQTDAGVLDGNVGGAAIDLDGNIVGMITIWDPAQHGRNSGIGFVVPWDRIRASIPALLRGERPARGMLGIYFGRSTRPRIDRVVADGGASRAGVLPGDVIVGVDGQRTPTIVEVLEHIAQRMAGERVRLRVERGGRVLEVSVTLGRRSI